MINAKKGIVEINGTEVEIMADVAVILKSVTLMLENEYGTEKAEKYMEKLIRRSRLSEEELEEELRQKILKELFGEK